MIPPGYNYRQAGRMCARSWTRMPGSSDILKSDPTARKKQRHTILRVLERLSDERGFEG